MRNNVGKVEAIIRITFGLVGMAWSTAEMSRQNRFRNLHLYIAMMSAMKVAEGIVRFCPMKAIFSLRKIGT